jgi:metal-sulfur cluster biosynthetic enzyme
MTGVDAARVRRVAGAVKDPEVRTSIAELGLLDEVEVDGGRVTVRFHLTSPLCPAKFAGAIGQQIRRRVAKLRESTPSRWCSPTTSWPRRCTG